MLKGNRRKFMKSVIGIIIAPNLFNIKTESLELEKHAMYDVELAPINKPSEKYKHWWVGNIVYVVPKKWLIEANWHEGILIEVEYTTKGKFETQRIISIKKKPRLTYPESRYNQKRLAARPNKWIKQRIIKDFT